MKSPQHLADMEVIAALFADATRRPEWWEETGAASIATALHREAWVEEVDRFPPPRTARFLNDLEFARLLLSGGREAEISHANIAAYARHRTEQPTPRKKPPKAMTRWELHHTILTGGASAEP